MSYSDDEVKGTESEVRECFGCVVAAVVLVVGAGAGFSGCDGEDGEGDGGQITLPDSSGEDGTSDAAKDAEPEAGLDALADSTGGDTSSVEDGSSDGTADGGPDRDVDTGSFDTVPPPPPDVSRDVPDLSSDALGGVKDADGGRLRPCCYPDDSCAMTTRTKCGNQGGIVAIESPDCSAVNCSTYTPKYACCSGGQCSEKTRYDCRQSGGVARLDRRCGQVTCSGASAHPCCLSQMGANFCRMYTTTDCNRLGGSPQTASDCSQVSCGTGQNLWACCTTRGCIMTTSSTCSTVQGTFHMGDTCSTKQCP